MNTKTYIIPEEIIDAKEEAINTILNEFKVKAENGSRLVMTTIMTT